MTREERILVLPSLPEASAAPHLLAAFLAQVLQFFELLGGEHRGQRVGGRHAQIVVTMGREDDGIRALYFGNQPADQVGLVARADPDRADRQLDVVLAVERLLARAPASVLREGLTGVGGGTLRGGPRPRR